MGFAILMTGMDTMSNAVSPLADDAGFRSMFTWFSHPIPGMLAGAVLTAVIQSSSASIGILQALCTAGAVSYGAAIPIILGQNIGTCATALISSIGAEKNAKRAAMIHLYFNLIGTVLFMTVFYAINAVRPFAFLALSAEPVGIAVIHTLFNVGCAVILYPFGNLLMKLAVLSVPEK
jgi:phosphate:Na+ symporter